ncbi:hypothetical protein Cni_G17933 [Canna indica]|uniref:Uncharacterized protein n=1 Tax=Canna indica TaxID=4628 RepID=A0AAQ3QI79_9LILI|nr:hypothetical protein Cni_G17933 [Canna indica]
MLRKRTRPVQKDQSKGFFMPHSSSSSCFPSDGVVKKTTSTSFLSVPGILDGFGSSKGLSESDAVWSPKSPLDKVFSSIGNSNLGSPRSTSINGRLKCWDSSRVGLGLVDTLNDENKPCGKVLGNIVFGSQMRFNISIPQSFLACLRDDPVGAAPKSLPHDNGIFSHPHIGLSEPCSIHSETAKGLQGSGLAHEEFGLLRACSVDTGRSSLLLAKTTGNNLRSNSELLGSDSKNPTLDCLQLDKKETTNFDKMSGSLPISFGSSQGFISSISASEIEQSEDYTCIISHGPNPRMTHIYGDCIIESHSIESSLIKNKKEDKGSTWLSASLLSCSYSDSLSLSFSRKKNLEEQKDICMHRDENGDQEALIKEEIDKPSVTSAVSPDSSLHEERFLDEITLTLNHEHVSI